MNTKDKKFMKKTMRGIFLFALGIMIFCGGNAVRNEKIVNAATAGDALENRIEADGRKNLYIGKGQTKDICYISYGVEIRKNGDGHSRDQKVTVMRIIKK